MVVIVVFCCKGVDDESCEVTGSDLPGATCEGKGTGTDENVIRLFLEDPVLSRREGTEFLRGLCTKNIIERRTFDSRAASDVVSGLSYDGFRGNDLEVRFA